MDFIHKFLVLQLFVVGLFTELANGLRCYECLNEDCATNGFSSFLEVECGHTQNPKGTAQFNDLIKKGLELSNKNIDATSLTKTLNSLTTYSCFKTTSDGIVVRGCFPGSGLEGSQTATVKGVEVESNYCATELCNGSLSLKAYSVYIIAMILTSTLMAKFIN